MVNNSKLNLVSVVINHNVVELYVFRFPCISLFILGLHCNLVSTPFNYLY